MEVFRGCRDVRVIEELERGVVLVPRGEIGPYSI